MGNNSGRTNMAETIIRLWLSETEMIACGEVSELDACWENTNTHYGCQLICHGLTVLGWLGPGGGCASSGVCVCVCHVLADWIILSSMWKLWVLLIKAGRRWACLCHWTGAKRKKIIKPQKNKNKSKQQSSAPVKSCARVTHLHTPSLSGPRSPERPTSGPAAARSGPPTPGSPGSPPWHARAWEAPWTSPLPLRRQTGCLLGEDKCNNTDP